MKHFIPAIPLLLLATAHADVSLPATFSGHLILKADAAVPVWSRAAAGGLGASIAGQTKSVKADEKGNWRVKLDPLESGESTSMTANPSHSPPSVLQITRSDSTRKKALFQPFTSTVLRSVVFYRGMR